MLPAPHTVYALHAPGGTPPKVPLLGLPVGYRRQAEHVCREPRACHDFSAAWVPRAHLQLLVLPLQVLQDELQLVLVLALALAL